MCVQVEQHLRLRSAADSEATRSRLLIPRAANLHLRSSADSAAVLHFWCGVIEHIGTLYPTHVAGIGALVALICYILYAAGTEDSPGLPSSPCALLLSPAFPPIDHL